MHKPYYVAESDVNKDKAMADAWALCLYSDLV